MDEWEVNRNGLGVILAERGRRGSRCVVCVIIVEPVGLKYFDTYSGRQMNFFKLILLLLKPQPKTQATATGLSHGCALFPWTVSVSRVPRLWRWGC